MQNIIDVIAGVPVRPTPHVWNKVVDGEKVPGDHKKTNPGTRKPETIAEVGGKINICIKNFNAKKSAYGPGGYKRELLRYLKELKQLGGDLTEGQRLKLNDIRDPDVQSLIGDLFIEADAPQVAAPPVDVDDPMVRPQDTPRRPSPDSQEEAPPPAKRPVNHHIQPRILNPTEAPVTAAAAPIEVDTPDVVMDTQGAVSGGNDPAGNGAMWSCQSHAPEIIEQGGKLKLRFGGSRLQYTWAMDMRAHNISELAADFVPIGHSLAWEVPSFYCTPADWKLIPFQTHKCRISRVGVAVTPVGKETQFNTASGTSTIASNEHLCVAFKSVGMNFRHDIPATGYRRVKNNESSSTLITNVSENIDWVDLRKRYWGPLSDWTSGETPARYGTTSQVSCAELSIRENEIVCGVYVDPFDKSTKANNVASFGALLKDRLVERFPLTPAIGKPIIQEIYEPIDGTLNYQPHRYLLKGAKDVSVFGKENTSAFLYSSAGSISVDNKMTFINRDESFSRNANIAQSGYELGMTGSYHTLIEKYRNVHGQSGYDTKTHTGKSMPMLTFGLCPIRLINIASSAPEYVNARVIWKIDYFMEVECEFMRPEYCFATNISADSTIYPVNMYTSLIPRHMLNPCTYNSTLTEQPQYETLAPKAIQFQKNGQISYDYVYADTVNGIMGAGASDDVTWKQSTQGLKMSAA